MSNYIMLGFATFFAALALILTAISFATDHWVETTVDRDDIQAEINQGGPNANALNRSLSESPAYFSRNRGLFRTCYEGENAFFLDQAKYVDDLTDGNCLIERGYEIDGEDQRVDDSDYDTRIHLMRTHFAFYIVGMIFLILAVVLGAVGCWRFWTSPCGWAAFCAFAAIIFIGGGIAFFHGYEYLECEEINKEGFPKYDLQDTVLAANTKTDYGYSYILGWIAVGCALISGILYLCVAWSIRTYKRERREKQYQPQFDQYNQYNAGYQQPMVIPPQAMTPAMTPVPSVMGGYGPSLPPASYLPPAQPMYASYGY